VLSKFSAGFAGLISSFAGSAFGCPLSAFGCCGCSCASSFFASPAFASCGLMASLFTGLPLINAASFAAPFGLFMAAPFYFTLVSMIFII